MSGTHCKAQLFEQLGPTIIGGNLPSEPLFGSSVAISDDAKIVAIGAPENDPTGSQVGQAYVFSWQMNEWIQLGQIISGSQPYDYFGAYVTLSQDGLTLAIGAVNGGNANEGSVSVYTLVAGTWVQKGQDILGESPNDGSCICKLSGDGNIVIIGSAENDDFGFESGQVRVYEWDGTIWNQKGQDLNGISDSQFGQSISISQNGSVIAVGAPHYSGSDFLIGQVSVYEWTGMAWQLKGNTVDGLELADLCGADVALSNDGNILAIGSSGNSNSNGYNAGVVKVYKWNISDWEQMGNGINGEHENDECGQNVDINGDGSRVVIGVIGNNDAGYFAGHTRIFDWNGSNWVQVEDDFDGEMDGDISGDAVCINSSGDSFVVGESLGNAGTGQVKVYSLSHVKIDENQINQHFVFPNPFSDIITLNFQFNIETTYTLVNSLGQTIIENAHIPSNNQIDFSALERGIYFLILSNSEETYSAKIIKY